MSALFVRSLGIRTDAAILRDAARCARLLRV
jgi:hypothetical protein